MSLVVPIERIYADIESHATDIGDLRSDRDPRFVGQPVVALIGIGYISDIIPFVGGTGGQESAYLRAERERVDEKESTGKEKVLSQKT